MTPDQQRKISRIEARNSSIYLERKALPDHVKASLDEEIPKSLPVIVRHGRTNHGSIYWYNDWCYEDMP